MTLRLKLALAGLILALSSAVWLGWELSSARATRAEARLSAAEGELDAMRAEQARTARALRVLTARVEATVKETASAKAQLRAATVANPTWAADSVPADVLEAFQ